MASLLCCLPFVSRLCCCCCRGSRRNAERGLPQGGPQADPNLASAEAEPGTDEDGLESSCLFGMCCVSKTSVNYMILFTLILPSITLFFLYFGDIKNKEKMCEIIQYGIDGCNDLSKYFSMRSLDPGTGTFTISVLSAGSTAFTLASAGLSGFRTSVISLGVDVSGFHLSIYELLQRKTTDFIVWCLGFCLTLPLTLVAFCVGLLTTPLRAMMISFGAAPSIALLASQAISSVVVCIVFNILVRLALKIEASVWRAWCCCCCSRTSNGRRARSNTIDQTTHTLSLARPDQVDVLYQMQLLRADISDLHRRQAALPAVGLAAALPVVRQEAQAQ
jgi:hypothetical protein